MTHLLEAFASIVVVAAVLAWLFGPSKKDRDDDQHDDHYPDC